MPVSTYMAALLGLMDRLTMASNPTQYLLFAEASRNRNTRQLWRFVLQNLDTQRRLTASDFEEEATTERLELLALVRGLEAIEGAAKVTLVTKSRYLAKGLKFGIDEWRDNNWRWERFGKIVKVRDCDLWRRVDHALDFHKLDCQMWHFDEESLEQDTSRSCKITPTAISKSEIFLDYQSSKSYRPKAWKSFSGPLEQVVGASA